MANLEVTINPVKDGPEFLRALDEYGLNIPDRGKSAESLEKKRFDLLVCRVGDVAAGIVMVIHVGAMEPECVSVVASSFPGEDLPIPAISGLEVKEEYRRQGIGRRLTLAAEDCILNHDGVADRAVLSVRRENIPAINLYHSVGYRALSRDGQIVFETTAGQPTPGGEYKIVQVISYFMAKDLSPNTPRA